MLVRRLTSNDFGRASMFLVVGLGLVHTSGVLLRLLAVWEFSNVLMVQFELDVALVNFADPDFMGEPLNLFMEIRKLLRLPYGRLAKQFRKSSLVNRA